jgi:hypothetical protein
MIQHVVLINFRHGVTEEQRQECVRRLRRLSGVVPGLRTWRVGCNVAPLERAWDLGLTAEFDDVDAVLAYRAHPAHLEAEAFVDACAEETVGIDFDPSA